MDNFNIDLETNDTFDITLEGAGSGGTSNYEDLYNKPQINSVELIGNKSFEDLGLDEWLELLHYGKVYEDTKANWASRPTEVSEAGAIYIYSDQYIDGNQKIPAIKIGDGLAYIVDLPFIDKKYSEHIANATIHISADERRKWNKKVDCYIDGNKLIFTREEI